MVSQGGAVMEHFVYDFRWPIAAAMALFVFGIGGWLALAWLRGRREDPLEKDPPMFI